MFTKCSRPELLLNVSKHKSQKIATTDWAGASKTGLGWISTDRQTQRHIQTEIQTDAQTWKDTY